MTAVTFFEFSSSKASIRNPAALDIMTRAFEAFGGVSSIGQVTTFVIRERIDPASDQFFSGKGVWKVAGREKVFVFRYDGG